MSESLHDLYFGGDTKLKVILCGQKSFAVAIYNMIREKPGVRILAFYAPTGDKLYELAGKLARPSGTLRGGSMPEDCDLLIAAHSHDFISGSVREKLKIGAVGYHPSLLPRHRGKDAIKWAVKMGDKITGGTVYWLDDFVDGGAIAAQDWCFIRPEDNASSLWSRALFPMGVRLLSKVLDDICAGYICRIDQDNSLATWEPALTVPPLQRTE